MHKRLRLPGEVEVKLSDLEIPPLQQSYLYGQEGKHPGQVEGLVHFHWLAGASSLVSRQKCGLMRLFGCIQKQAKACSLPTK